MRQESQKNFLGKIPILLGLLLCLCFSKGEGVHLLPFSDAPENPQTSVFEIENTSLKYQLSTHHQNGFDGKFQSKHIKTSGKILAAAADLSFGRLFSVAEVSLKFFVSKPKSALSKFLLTASSDRSPPFAASL